ncbi:hypothetical protein A0Y59_07835 [Campylobacter lari]|uniref:Uncharacterized protein n=1 Tax=Campylobacter lari TaxID=201 RepID=A0A7U8AR32_CAMLA|nr:hypothetical protein [Campylobacter lari]
MRNGKLIGVIGALGSLTQLQEELTNPERSVFKDDQRLLLGDDGLIAVSPATEFIGKNITEINPHPSANLLVELQKVKQILYLISHQLLQEMQIEQQ